MEMSQVLGLIALALVLAAMVWWLRRVEKKGRAEQTPATDAPALSQAVVVSAEAMERVDETAKVLAALLLDESSADYETLRKRLMLSAEGPLQGQYLHAPGEVAEGLLMMARVFPQIALHDENVKLLGKLRALTGTRNFLDVCAHISAALKEEQHAELAEGLRKGTLPWSELLFLMRSLQIEEEAVAVDYKFEARPSQQAS
jgi:hypothetical protein